MDKQDLNPCKCSEWLKCRPFIPECDNFCGPAAAWRTEEMCFQGLRELGYGSVLLELRKWLTDHRHAGVAQLGEQQPPNLPDAGSTPAPCAKPEVEDSRVEDSGATQ